MTETHTLETVSRHGTLRIDPKANIFTVGKHLTD